MLDGDTYGGLTWLDSTPKPTPDELEAAWQELSTQVTPEQRRAAMAEAFDELPLAAQAVFWTPRIAAETAMDRGRFDIAKAIIEAQSVPPELADTKAAILAHFPA